MEEVKSREGRETYTRPMIMGTPVFCQSLVGRGPSVWARFD